jgi:hypothetical protein
MEIHEVFVGKNLSHNRTWLLIFLGLGACLGCLSKVDTIGVLYPGYCASPGMTQ